MVTDAGLVGLGCVQYERDERHSGNRYEASRSFDKRSVSSDYRHEKAKGYHSYHEEAPNVALTAPMVRKHPGNPPNQDIIFKDIPLSLTDDYVSLLVCYPSLLMRFVKSCIIL